MGLAMKLPESFGKLMNKVAKEGIKGLTDEEKIALEEWAHRIKGVLEGDEGDGDKKSKLDKIMEEAKATKEIVLIMLQQAKRVLWKDRNVVSRMFIWAILSSLISIITAGFVSIGLATGGTAYGVPLFVAFGALGATATSIISALENEREVKKLTKNKGSED